jgi:D-3-phosphoglycerate dehydrogenase
MRALVSAQLTADIRRAIAKTLSWQVDQVASVSAAVPELSDTERAEVVALIVETEPVTEALMVSLPSLEVVAGLRGDPVNVDQAAATRLHVPVIYAPGRNAESVADFTLGLLLATIRNITISHHGMLSGSLTVSDEFPTRHGADVIWSAPGLGVRPYEHFMGPELSSLAVAVVGYGNIGRAVARRLGPLVRALVVVDPMADEDEVRADGFVKLPLYLALREADVVSLHARSATQIIGQAELDRMKPGSYLINTARATVLDYDALARALWSGHLGGAALDVFPEEPLRTSSPLMRAPRLTLTPHIAGASFGVIRHHSRTLLRSLMSLYTGNAWTGIPVANPEVRVGWKGGPLRIGAMADASMAVHDEEDYP